MIIDIIRKSLYLLLKITVLAYQSIFYPFTKVTNKERLNFDGPGILVSNHPNTLTDPLHVLSRTKRFSFLLANASMFEHPFANWFLSHFFCIPIKRPGRDKGKRAVNNAKSFAKSTAHLTRGGIIYIAPEGSSVQERHLREVKTGTARITLNAEAANDFKLGIRIVPTGLTYENPSYCGSRMMIKVGKPIFVKDFQEDYENNPKLGVNNLTKALEEQMQSLLIHTDDDEQDELLRRLETVLQNDTPLPIGEHYERAQNVLDKLKNTKEKDVNEYQNLLSETTAYYTSLKDNNLRDRGLSVRKKSLFTILAFFGFPIWLYGKINHFAAMEIPRMAFRKSGLYKGYAAAVKILTGVFIFPLFYWLQFLLIRYFTTSTVAWFYLLSLPIFGILAWQYMRYMRPRWEAMQFRKFYKKNKQQGESLLQQRANLKASFDLE